MSPFKISADKKIDAAKLDAWIQMNTVSAPVHSPGPAFVYVGDLEAGMAQGQVDPVQLQKLIEEKTVRDEQPSGRPFIYVDDLMDGFRGSRLDGGST